MGLVLLRPVLLGPVTGDDVYYSLNAAADPDRTVVTDVARLPREGRYRVAKGRVNVLTAVERRTSGRAMVERSDRTIPHFSPSSHSVPKISWITSSMPSPGSASRRALLSVRGS